VRPRNSVHPARAPARQQRAGALCGGGPAERARAGVAAAAKRARAGWGRALASAVAGCRAAAVDWRSSGPAAPRGARHAGWRAGVLLSTGARVRACVLS